MVLSVDVIPLSSGTGTNVQFLHRVGHEMTIVRKRMTTRMISKSSNFLSHLVFFETEFALTSILAKMPFEFNGATALHFVWSKLSVLAFQ